MDNDSTGNLIKGASRLAIALIFGATALAAHAAPVTTQGTWWGTDGTDGTLQARDINGNAVALSSTDAKLFYDTELDITWLGDWNANGLMNWTTATNWAAALDINGYTGWRLPELSGTLVDNYARSGTDLGYNVKTANSEMAHMWYETLGNLAFYATSWAGPQPGWGLINTAYFQNMQSSIYWSGTKYAPSQSGAWHFFTDDGMQTITDISYAFHAVAVRPGDVLGAQTVPEPGTLGLLLGALGAGAVVRRRRAH